jgi:transcriptional regulator with XRE-family HTH domain
MSIGCPDMICPLLYQIMSGLTKSQDLSEHHAVKLARFQVMAQRHLEALGVAIHERRKELGLSVSRLAQRFPVDPKTVDRWEKAQVGSAHGQIDQIAEKLETTPEKIMARALEIQREGAEPLVSEPAAGKNLDDLSGEIADLRSELMTELAHLSEAVEGLRKQQRPAARKASGAASR